jgi:hypothetical protein
VFALIWAYECAGIAIWEEQTLRGVERRKKKEGGDAEIRLIRGV